MRLQEILILLGLAAVAYFVYQKRDEVASALERATGQPVGSYQTYISQQSVPTQAAVTAGNVITPTPILTGVAQVGYQVGIDLNECRGTLRVEDVPAYNALSQADRLEYNTWACNQNTAGTAFHYAPSPSAWKPSSFLSAYLSPITAWWS